MEYKHYIEGEKIYLREVRITDVNEEYYQWMNDSEVNQYLETRFIPQSIESIRKYVEKFDGSMNEIFLAICLKENDKHIGNIKLGPINWIHRFSDVSLILGDKNYWGKGIATEAIKLITNYAFTVLNLHKLRAGCYEQNVASKKAFEKAGYGVESVFNKQYMFNSKYVNIFSLTIFNEK
jgi:RimJ/RimL family protein N-acetyltransferase